MARLYEITPESASGEITSSLAQSLKNGLFAPTEKKFSTLETEIMALTQLIELETGKLTLEANEKFYHLEKELVQVRKWNRFTVILSLASLMGIIVTLIILFNWYS
ncbi:hypothetical protein [Sporotomaculum syntrophicum]|nr:hypothetical protein [Sporotomaculum syntrophicum]